MDYSYLPVRAESMQLLTEGTLAYSFWTCEVLLGILVPLVILFHNKLRHQKAALIVAGFLMAFALIVNRWNTNMVGLLAPTAYVPSVMPKASISYTPTWVEWATAGGILGYSPMAFTLGMRFLPIFPLMGTSDKLEEAEPAKVEPVASSISAIGQAGR